MSAAPDAAPRRLVVRVVLALLVMVAMVAALAAVAFGYDAYTKRDRRAEVAAGLLGSDDGGLDIKAAGALLTSRFADGIPATEVSAFVDRLGGQCTEDDGYGKNGFCGNAGRPRCDDLPHTRLRCEVPVTGGVCSKKNLLILARLHEDRTVSGIYAVRSGKCVNWSPL